MHLNKPRIFENTLCIFFAFLPFALVFFFMVFWWIDYKTAKLPDERMAEQQKRIEKLENAPKWYRTE